MMRATILIGDDATVETEVHGCGRGTLTVRHHGGTIRVESLDPTVWSRIAHAAQAVVTVRLTTDGTWLLACRHCAAWTYVASCRSDADDHARWHRDAHRIAARAER